MRNAKRKSRINAWPVAWQVALAVHLLGAWILAHIVESTQARHQIGNRPPSPIELTIGFEEEMRPNRVAAEQASALTVTPAEARMADHKLVDTPATDVSIDQLLSTEALKQIEEWDESRDRIPSDAGKPDSIANPILPTNVARVEIAQPIERQLPEPTVSELPRADLEPRAVTTRKSVAANVASPPSAIVAPDFSGNAPPSYPRRVARLGWTGEVLLELGVDRQGKVTKVVVLRSSGYPILDAAAVSTIRNWQGKPATRNGEPVASTWKLPIQFAP